MVNTQNIFASSILAIGFFMLPVLAVSTTETALAPRYTATLGIHGISRHAQSREEPSLTTETALAPRYTATLGIHGISRPVESREEPSLNLRKRGSNWRRGITNTPLPRNSISDSLHHAAEDDDAIVDALITRAKKMCTDLSGHDVPARDTELQAILAPGQESKRHVKLTSFIFKYMRKSSGNVKRFERVRRDNAKMENMD